MITESRVILLNSSSPFWVMNWALTLGAFSPTSGPLLPRFPGRGLVGFEFLQACHSRALIFLSWFVSAALRIFS